MPKIAAGSTINKPDFGDARDHSPSSQIRLVARLLLQPSLLRERGRRNKAEKVAHNRRCNNASRSKGDTCEFLLQTLHDAQRVYNKKTHNKLCNKILPALGNAQKTRRPHSNFRGVPGFKRPISTP